MLIEPMEKSRNPVIFLCIQHNSVQGSYVILRVPAVACVFMKAIM